jgi:predicted transcriptional regulator
MDIVYSRGAATATQITSELPDPPCQAAVRTMIRILEARGHIKHFQKGREFVYQPTSPRAKAADKALERVLNVFFGGSLEEAVAAHLAEHAGEMKPEQLKRLSALIRKAKEQGK